MNNETLFVIDGHGTLYKDGSISFRVLEGAENIESAEGFEITNDMIYNPYEEEPDIY